MHPLRACTNTEWNKAKDFVATVDVTHPDDPAFGTILANNDAPYSVSSSPPV